MILQGFPIERVSDLVSRTPDRLLGDLAGNMVATPVLLLLLMASIASVDWQQESVVVVRENDERARSERNDALAALAMLAAPRKKAKY